MFSVKHTFGYILLAILTLALAHCGRGNAAPGIDEQPAELLWVTLDVNSQVEETLAANFREGYPNITFQRQPLNTNQNYLASTPAPDVLMSFANRAYEQAGSENQLTDLDEVWQAASFGDNSLANVQEMVTNRESGKVHMLPVAFIWTAVYYNKAIFAQYGLQPPQSWDEFLHICATLQANGEIPLAIAGSGGYANTLWFDYLNLRLNGAEFHRALLAGKERFDDPRVAAALEMWLSLFQQGYVLQTPGLMNAQTAINTLMRNDNGLLGQEKAAMVLVDTYTLSGTPATLRAEIDFFPFPQVTAEIPTAEVIDVIGYVIPTAANHPAQAQRFLTYLGSPPAQTLIAREAAVIEVVFAPVRTDIESDALTPETTKAISLVQAAAETVPFTPQAMPPALWTEFDRAYTTLLRDPQDIYGFMTKMESARQLARTEGNLE